MSTPNPELVQEAIDKLAASYSNNEGINTLADDAYNTLMNGNRSAKFKLDNIVRFSDAAKQKITAGMHDLSDEFLVTMLLLTAHNALNDYRPNTVDAAISADYQSFIKPNLARMSFALGEKYRDKSTDQYNVKRSLDFHDIASRAGIQSSSMYLGYYYKHTTGIDENRKLALQEMLFRRAAFCEERNGMYVKETYSKQVCALAKKEFENTSAIRAKIAKAINKEREIVRRQEELVAGIATSAKIVGALIILGSLITDDSSTPNANYANDSCAGINGMGRINSSFAPATGLFGCNPY